MGFIFIYSIFCILFNVNVIDLFITIVHIVIIQYIYMKNGLYFYVRIARIDNSHSSVIIKSLKLTNLHLGMSLLQIFLFIHVSMEYHYYLRRCLK